eukprot:TRINITY_DN32141_c0_g1_i1.p1 TRINITY_DN32141_c0_g1~~TRINITY_DN32141_c0_g1_i1.p1  ORF type:complete len:287 (+),score=63.92 TRINITY_DN32141_c0_g1_i1:53-862(+)
MADTFPVFVRVRGELVPCDVPVLGTVQDVLDELEKATGLKPSLAFAGQELFPTQVLADTGVTPQCVLETAEPAVAWHRYHLDGEMPSRHTLKSGDGCITAISTADRFMFSALDTPMKRGTLWVSPLFTCAVFHACMAFGLILDAPDKSVESNSASLLLYSNIRTNTRFVAGKSVTGSGTAGTPPDCKEFRGTALTVELSHSLQDKGPWRIVVDADGWLGYIAADGVLLVESENVQQAFKKRLAETPLGVPIYPYVCTYCKEGGEWKISS